MSIVTRAILALLLFCSCLAISCDKKKGALDYAPPGPKVKKVRVGTGTLTLVEEEEDDLEAKPAPQAVGPDG